MSLLDKHKPDFRESLERERVRSGYGWFGERLPEGPKGYLHASHERLIYKYKTRPDDVAIEMVHVPAGPFSLDAHDRTWKLNAFWIGRYPVTWEQYLAFCAAAKRRPPDPPWFWGRSLPKDAHPAQHEVARVFAMGPLDHHPVTGVSLDDATAFCEWAGLSLPTETEWAKAARGDLSRNIPCARCGGKGEVGDVFCKRCLGRGSRLRTYPWGDEPPTPATCVVDAHGTCLTAVSRPKGKPERRRPITAPVLLEIEEEDFEPWEPSSTRLKPVRPAGASPFGCIDMVGNSFDLTLGQHLRFARGGIVGNQPATVLDILPADKCPRELLGFRVVLRPPS